MSLPLLPTSSLTFATNTEDAARIAAAPLNKYMSHYNNAAQRDLYSSLTAESIQKNGIELIYILRDSQHLDLIFGEDPTSAFKECYRTSMYLSTPEGFTTQATIDKFGIFYGNELELITEPNLFGFQVPSLSAHGPRPGDLIYWDIDKSLFEVIWVSAIEQTPFRVHGAPAGSPQIKLNIRKFVYSGETVATDANSVYPDSPANYPVIDNISTVTDDHKSPTEREQIQQQGDALAAVIDEMNPFGIQI